MSDMMVQIMLGLFGGVDILGIIGFIVYYRQNKKSKELDNNSKDIDNIGKQNDNYDRIIDSVNKVVEIMEEKFNASEEDSKRKQAEIDELRKEKEQLIKEKIEVLELNGELRIKNQQLEFIKCKKLDCPSRIPPMYSASKVSGFIDNEDTHLD